MLMSIAPYKKPRAQNVPGNLFVDEGYYEAYSFKKLWTDDKKGALSTISTAMNNP